MSSKTEPDTGITPRPAKWSLATRLTAWYAGSSFGLILAATGLLYWALVGNLNREDDQSLGDQVRVLRAALEQTPGDTAAARREVREEWEARRNTRVHARVIDRDGRVFVETPGMDRVLPPSLFPVPTAEPGGGTDVRSDGGGSYRLMSVTVGAGPPDASSRVIQVGMDHSPEAELLAEYRKNLVLVLGGALVACVATGFQIARRGMRPIHEITETAARIRPSNLGERITPDGLPAELHTLAGQFNQMLDRLELSFDRLSRFSADIAHELRTPLHSLGGEVELALTRPRTPDEYRDVLASNLEEVGRLNRMVESLLFLARAENPKTQVGRERFDVGGELATVCEFFEAGAAEAGVRLTVSGSEQIQVDLNRSLFGRAVSNLVANALDHTKPGGSVVVSYTTDADAFRVFVSDTGCGIPADHLPHVFDRFYRADPARSPGGIGLGLAIVRSVVELHGGSVELASEFGRGTRVSMRFPRT
ncbi:MAG: heavy metal sensor histidine kinase [Gemmataceae bacterium]